MTSINEISISYAALLGFNSLALLALWAEYSNSRQRFIKYALLGQVCMLLWLAVNFTLILTSGSQAVFYVSSFVLGSIAFWFLAASANHEKFNTKIYVAVASTYAIGLLADYFAQLGLLDWIRNFSMLMFFLAPLASVIAIKGGFRFLLSALQLFAAITLYLGLTYLYSDRAAVGALLYLLAGLLFPINSICFVILSTTQSRQRVAESEKKYRVFFEAVDDVFFETDKNLQVQNVSPSIAQFGIAPEQMLGRSISEYVDEGEKFLRLANTSIDSNEAFQFSGNFLASDGQIDCEIACTPMQGDKNTPLQFAGTIRNTQERNQLERQFINAQRHESLGKLAGGIAHDFNNLLQGIMGHAELLKKDGLSSERRHISLDAIAKGATSAGGLCRQLLLYTGTGANIKEDFDLCEQVREIADIIRPSIADQGDINVERMNCPICIRGDKAQVGQVVMNLVKNALESGQNKIHVRVSLTSEKLEDPLAIESQIGCRLKKGDYAKLVVEDDGEGISQSIISKIFDPFFTTKERGHGLGLAAIVGILTAHDGTISVNSKHGHGTTFTVWIPIIENPNIQTLSSEADSDEALKILHVDDEFELLEVGKSMLEQMGHEVMTATSGTEALDILSNQDKKFDLVISDIKMPGMDGITLMREMFHKYPDLSVVLASGYADVTNALTSKEAMRVDFLGKPYNLNELLVAIDSARLKSQQDVSLRN